MKTTNELEIEKQQITLLRLCNAYLSLGLLIGLIWVIAQVIGMIIG